MNSVSVFKEEGYCLVSSFQEDATHLVKKVNDLLKDGWRLKGGIASSNSKIFQSLVKA